jgi:hypothetical protein
MIETVCSPSPDLLSSGVTHPDRMNDLIGYGLESCQPPAFSHNGKPLKGSYFYHYYYSLAGRRPARWSKN